MEHIRKMHTFQYAYICRTSMKVVSYFFSLLALGLGIFFFFQFCCFSEKATISPIQKPSAEEKLAPHEHCMLQKWSYHQKHCRPFQHYMLQKSSYQTAKSPQSSDSRSQITAAIKSEWATH